MLVLKELKENVRILRLFTQAQPVLLYASGRWLYGVNPVTIALRLWLAMMIVVAFRRGIRYAQQIVLGGGSN